MNKDLHAFRVYDKKEGRYLDCNNAPMLGMNGELFFHQKGATWATSEDPDRYEYEPSIGRRDVNNDLIYAGDLIECCEGLSGVYLVHPDNVLKDFYCDDDLEYHLEDTFKPRIVGNVHDNPLPDTALPEIYVVVKRWRGLLRRLYDRGWTINDLLKYKNGNDLFHDIVKNERKCSDHWYTDHFLGGNWHHGDTVYVDPCDKIVGKNNIVAIRRMLWKIDRTDCNGLLERVKGIYGESGE